VEFFGVLSFGVQIRYPLSVQYLSGFGHTAFGHLMLGPYSALGPIWFLVIRCSVIWRLVIWHPVFRQSVIRRSVIRRSVIRRLVIRRSVIHRSVIRRSVIRRSVIRRLVIRRSVIWRPVFSSAGGKGTAQEGWPYLPFDFLLTHFPVG
jgi:hypothetical protein